MRRSVAQKFIKHFLSLGVDPFLSLLISCCFNVEIAQTYSSAESTVKQDLFYPRSMLYFLPSRRSVL